MLKGLGKHKAHKRRVFSVIRARRLIGYRLPKKFSAERRFVLCTPGLYVDARHRRLPVRVMVAIKP
jgi:hypothetical protein